MKFSVIIPIYNIEKYITKCLDSIISQTYMDFEVILVDDGSTDNCPLICDEYALNDKRIKVIHKENGGRVRARQIGAQEALGDYIVCIDGDDWVSPDFLYNFSTIIDRYNPDVVVCNSIYAYPDKNIKNQNSLRKGFYSTEDLEKEVYPSLVYGNRNGRGFPAQLWAKAFRRNQYLQRQLVDVTVEMGEDRACTISILYNCNSLFVADFYDYFYRQTPTSITRAKKPYRDDGPKLIYEHLANQLDLDKFDFDSQLYQSTCHSLFNVCKSQFYADEDYFKTRKRIVEILSDSIYSDCIKKAKFKGSVSRRFMHLALKYKLVFLMYLYSKL